jgi:hypothetical protein
MSADDSLPDDVETLKTMLIAAQAACLEAQAKIGISKGFFSVGIHRYRYSIVPCWMDMRNGYGTADDDSVVSAGIF